MKKIKDEIFIKTGEVQGYGGPGYSWAKVIWHNILLDEIERSYSPFDLGRQVERLTAKWKKNWTKVAFDKAIKGKKLASPWCDHCGKDTLDGGVSCVEKIFCKRCDKAGVIQQYIDKYQEQRDKDLKRIEERNAHWRRKE